MTKVAILGFGTVGSGVAEVLSKNSQGIARRSGGEIQVKYILDVRDFPDSPFKDCFVKDFSTPRWTWWWRPSAEPRWLWSSPPAP